MSPITSDQNLVLIGMPGVGKSTVGVLLAKAAGRSFVDTDLVLQSRHGRPLSSIIESDGLVAFCRMEEQCILSLDCRRHVIATGGSVVYSNSAMQHLRSGGPIIYLHLPLDLLAERLENMAARGVVIGPGRTLADLYEERRGLYEAWADVIIECSGLNQDRVVASITDAIKP